VPLLAAAADAAAVGGRTWCAARIWLGRASLYSADPTAALGHFTAVRDAIGDHGPSHVLAVSLAARSSTLLYLGRTAEAADDARRSVALAREAGYPDIEVLALVFLAVAATLTGDDDQAARLARQAQQIEAEIPAATARLFRHLLAVVLTEVGDLAAAEQACAAGLAGSREVGDVWNLAGLLIDMAFLDLRAGRVADAAAHLREQLQLALRSGFREDLLDGLNCCGYLCATTGRSAETVTLWAAFTTLRQQEGWISDVRPAHREEPWREARKALGPDRARVAEERGAAMSLATAAEYALMLAAADPHPAAAVDGQGRLSARERELITLVAQGRTDAQIATQMYISVRTVGSHLDRIRDKTGCRRRADLTRLALSAGLV
jgi:DNA-binding CsgD family transcriptional regulator